MNLKPNKTDSKKPQPQELDQPKLTKQLIAKEKALLRHKKVLVQFKEPVLFLMRNDGTVEFYENVKSDEFAFEASNEKELSIKLTPQKLHTFCYGNDTFKGYIAYEYESLPYPQDPLQTTETFVTAIINTLHTSKDWKTTRIQAKGNLVMKIAIGIAIVVAMYILWMMLKPTPPPSLPSVPLVP